MNRTHEMRFKVRQESESYFEIYQHIKQRRGYSSDSVYKLENLLNAFQERSDYELNKTLRTLEEEMKMLKEAYLKCEAEVAKYNE